MGSVSRGSTSANKMMKKGFSSIPGLARYFLKWQILFVTFRFHRRILRISFSWLEYPLDLSYTGVMKPEHIFCLFLHLKYMQYYSNLGHVLLPGGKIMKKAFAQACIRGLQIHEENSIKSAWSKNNHYQRQMSFHILSLSNNCFLCHVNFIRFGFDLYFIRKLAPWL